MSLPFVLVRGAGDLATGTIVKLHKSGIRVFAVECEKPSAIRRQAALCEAVYDGSATVEGVICRKITDLNDIERCFERCEVPLLVDEKLECLKKIKPVAVIDAIIAKKNLGTTMDMAFVTIALGPGFVAGEDVHAVIETQRGHNLGRVIYRGSAAPNTGIPGIIAGESVKRVIHSPATGEIKHLVNIGEIVNEGQEIAIINDTPVIATLDGVLRGLIREGYYVTKGMKIADIDPRKEQKENCTTISDKARCIAGGVLEAVIHLSNEQGVKLF